MNLSRMACIRNERAMACGRDAEAIAKPWCLVWYWQVWSAAGALDNKDEVSKEQN